MQAFNAVEKQESYKMSRVNLSFFNEIKDREITLKKQQLNINRVKDLSVQLLKKIKKT